MKSVAERFQSGHVDLRTVSFADMDILGHKVAPRVARQLGHQLTEQQSGELDSNEFHSKYKSPIEVSNIPELAVTETDDGRIRTRQPDFGTGTHNPSWKETKTALCTRMSSEVVAKLQDRIRSLCYC